MEFKAQIKNVEKFKESLQTNSDEYKYLLRLTDGNFVSIKTWKDRNVMFLRKFFAFLNAVIYLLPENSKYDRLRNKEYLRKQLMIITGNCDIVYDLKGKEHLQAHSISFESMDEVKFQEVYSSCVNAALKYYLHWISIKDFENTIANFL